MTDLFDELPSEDSPVDVASPSIQRNARSQPICGIAFVPVPSDWPLLWDADGDNPGARRRTEAQAKKRRVKAQRDNKSRAQNWTDLARAKKEKNVGKPAHRR